jgi:hypothetical protein
VNGAIAELGFVKLLRNRKQKWIEEFVSTAGPEISEKHEDEHDEPQSLSLMNSRSL